MADEIKLNLTLTVDNGTFKDRFAPGTIKLDQSSGAKHDVVVNVGTSEEDVTFAEITTEGVCLLYNLDATNFVQWGAKDTTMKQIGRLRPASIPALFHFEPGATLRMKADTAACEVRVIVYEL